MNPPCDTTPASRWQRLLYLWMSPTHMYETPYVMIRWKKFLGTVYIIDVVKKNIVPVDFASLRRP